MHEGRIAGFMALELSNRHVFRVLKDYSGLGETGESMVAMREGEEEFIYVAPPRNSQERPSSTGENRRRKAELAMQRAVEGQRGYGESIDYRGEPVVAAWSYLPSYRWGMVVKQDAQRGLCTDLPAASGRRRLLLAATFLIVTLVALLAGAHHHAGRSATLRS